LSEKSKGLKRFELHIKTTEVLMLKQKIKSNKERTQTRHWGGMKSILARKSKEKVRA